MYAEDRRLLPHGINGLYMENRSLGDTKTVNGFIPSGM